jgi:hypothetical protein
MLHLGTVSTLSKQDHVAMAMNVSTGTMIPLRGDGAATVWFLTEIVETENLNSRETRKN